MRHRFSKILFAAALLISALSCSTNKSSVAEKQFKLSGVVLSLNPKDQTANIKHGPVAGWMEGMTMDYPIRSKQEFDLLHEGDHITATVDVRGTDYDLTEIHKQSSQK
jgi:Cu/Ag efflux protein CusF